VASAMEVLGGSDSAAGSCVWHVVGLGCSVREWAMRQGWGGRTVRRRRRRGCWSRPAVCWRPTMGLFGMLGHWRADRSGLCRVLGSPML
jgi:hypothetical protein